VTEIAFRRVSAKLVALRSRAMESVDRGTDDRAPGGLDWRNKLVGERSLAGRVHAVDADSDGMVRREVGDAVRDILKERQSGGAGHEEGLAIARRENCWHKN
jgi:hypothetical protein